MTVAFTTLFLGLTIGVHPVAVVAADSVASVELLLDGRSVATAKPPTWTAPVDFGSLLAPHRLEAVAYDADRGELGRVTQRINLPRPAAEAEVVIEGGGDGRGAVARVAWESVEGSEPTRVTARLDGRPLEVDDPSRIPLPPHDPAQLHLFQVELEFSDAVSAVSEIPFGGAYGAGTRAELTALPVVPVDGAGRLSAEEMDGWFATVDGEPLEVVAVEEGPAEAVFILDGAAQPRIWELARTLDLQRTAARRGPHRVPERRGSATARPATRAVRDTMVLRDEQILRLLWPVPRRTEGKDGRLPVELFPRSEEHPPSHGGVLWLLSEAHQPPFDLADQRLTDAVAVAGMTSTIRSRRRAVVLILTERPADSSRFRPGNVRQYLEQLGVPLSVWVMGEVSGPMREVWGDPRPVGAIHRFGEAVSDLAEMLGRQRIVWFEGRHLPQEIVVTGRAKVRRAR